jgi:copper transport protein
MDAIHLLVMGSWLGGTVGLRIALTPLIQRQKEDYVSLSRLAWSPFSMVAALSVGVLFTSGLFATGEQVASLDALLTTTYGRVLLMKIGLFLGVGFFGLLNSMMLHPEVFAPLWRIIRRPPGWSPIPLKSMPAVTVIEASVGMVVLLMVSYLVANPVSNGPEYRYAAISQPNPLTQTAGELSITLNVKPNQPGSNTFNVQVADANGGVPADIMRVILRFKYQAESLGDVSVDAAQVGPGIYALQGNHFSMAGPWGVDVIVRRKGLLDSIAHYNWIVPPMGQARLISNRDWQPILLSLATVLLGMILLIPVGSLLVSRRVQGAS